MYQVVWGQDISGGGPVKQQAIKAYHVAKAESLGHSTIDAKELEHPQSYQLQEVVKCCCVYLFIYFIYSLSNLLNKEFVKFHVTRVSCLSCTSGLSFLCIYISCRLKFIYNICFNYK